MEKGKRKGEKSKRRELSIIVHRKSLVWENTYTNRECLHNKVRKEAQNKEIKEKNAKNEKKIC